MTPQNTSWRELALQLVGAVPGQGDKPVHLCVLSGLDTVLSRMVGTVGSRSLITRAVTLAQGEAKFLGAERVAPEHIMDHLEKQLGGCTSEERTTAEVVVVFNLLVLLQTFIGERLTLHLVQEAWPEFDLLHIELREDPKA